MARQCEGAKSKDGGKIQIPKFKIQENLKFQHSSLAA
jgi:hypothetical protein